MESSILSEVHNTSILRTGLSTDYAVISTSLAPQIVTGLRLRTRAAGWSGATSCLGASYPVARTAVFGRIPPVAKSTLGNACFGSNSPVRQTVGGCPVIAQCCRPRPANDCPHPAQLSRSANDRNLTHRSRWSYPAIGRCPRNSAANRADVDTRIDRHGWRRRRPARARRRPPHRSTASVLMFVCEKSSPLKSKGTR